MIQTPLLLRYKIRDCYSGSEAEIDSNADILLGRFSKFEKPKHEIWQLQLPDGNYLQSDSNARYSKKFEYHVAGDPSPVAVCFVHYIIETIKQDRIKTCVLPDDCISYDDINLINIFNSRVLPILNEYERCRDEWQARTVVGVRS